jgi:cytochrome P450
MSTVSETSGLRQFNPVSPALLKNPYPTYAAYRETDPVHWGTATMNSISGSWYVFRYDHNVDVLSDGKLFANDPATVGMDEHVPAAFKPVAYIFQHWLGGMDPPKHRVLRAALAKAFTPRRIADLEPGIVEITRELIDNATARTDGQIDVRADLAFPLPMAVVGAALGVAKEDWSLFQGWSADVTNAVDHAGEPDYADKGAAAIKAMADYFAGLVDARKKSPSDDLLSAMLAAAREEGKDIEEFDIIAIATELGVAGHETTANSVTKAVLEMMEQPGKWDEFVALPEEAVGNAIDELLRVTTPVQRQRWRWVTSGTTIGDKRLGRGDSVVSLLGAANRDPEVFEQPDVIDFSRHSAKHLTFGIGSHFCIGSHLAKLELRLALRSLARVLPEMELVEDPADIEWLSNYLLPAPKRVLVRAAGASA